MTYVFPELNRPEFHCPMCGVYSHQDWNFVEIPTGRVRVLAPEPRADGSTSDSLPNTRISTCKHCKKFSLWIDGEMIYPLTGDAPNPSPDMPIKVKEYYEEARSIVSRSPRGAAALLRLAVQELTNNILGKKKGKDLNNNIKILVKNGLGTDIQKSLDYVRLTGNNAVHPLERIVISDTKKNANSLFELVNFIVDDVITRHKKVNRLYGSLPRRARSNIKKRDKP